MIVSQIVRRWGSLMVELRPATITTLPIPASEAGASDPWRACLWVSQFIEEALGNRGYQIDELPIDAIRFADLWAYQGQQANGGHAQIDEDNSGDVSSCRRAASLLDTMGLPTYGSLLREFIDFLEQNQDRIEDLYERDISAARKLFYVFDDRFAQLQRQGQGLQAEMHTWLMKQPWVKLDDDDRPADMDRLRKSIPLHPELEVRQAAKKRLRLAESSGAWIETLRKQLGVK